MTSATHSEFTLEALRQIAPSAFTEVRGADGELTQKVDFKVLRELLGDAIADADEESFGFQWVGKQEAKRAAAKPTRQTLRPVVDDSVDWETTENLYIEGFISLCAATIRSSTQKDADNLLMKASI